MEPKNIEFKTQSIRINMIYFFVICGLILAPFDILLSTEHAKISLSVFLFTIGMLLWLPESKSIIKSNYGKKLLFALLGFMIIAFLGLLTSINKFAVIRESLQFSWIIVGIIVVWWVFQNTQIRYIYIRFLILTIIPVSVFALIQYFFFRFPFESLVADTRLRAQGYYDQPNTLGFFLVAFIPFYIFVIIERLKNYSLKKKIVVFCFLSILTVVTFAFAATFSRGSYIGLLVALIIAFFLSENIIRKTLIKIYGLIIIALVLIIVDARLQPNILREKSLKGLFGESRAFSNQQRWLLITTALKMTEDYPILGVGMGNYPARLLEYSNEKLKKLLQYDFNRLTQEFYFNPDRKMDVEIVHNVIIQVLCENGILGLIAFIGIWYLLLSKVWLGLKKEGSNTSAFFKIGAFCSIIAVIIAGLFGWPFTHGVQEILIAMCAIALPSDLFNS